MPAEVKIMHF